jgi:hypothetical protein
VVNFRMQRASLADTVRLLAVCCGLFAALLAYGADEPSHAPLPFACEVRYHFREHFRDAKPGQKNVSAPSYEREALPMSRIAVSDGSAARIVEGRVAHLPYQFLVRVSRSDKSQAEDLEVNVLDSSGKPLAGFPQVMPNPLTKTGDSSRKEFEIPVSEAVKKNIEKTLLEKDQFLTHVDLIAGMDDDFLSAHFSNVR